ncbi:NAD(P)-dependent oxidoreductase [Nocardioides albus]|uniref:Nucleoside-diphosphate-sugar epimerase n=1 Tax=Nocardioides albus TaxID=1841 RepID=A0A7W5A5B7_9ACTN|nr:NAD(P)H-binding protein [Nocardioides albus]MBB3089826.1 nucleoside-diphosphate-sugar epimerase [Nocardioides albus]GGU35888.1 NmrA family transcriptional regulator [Nocardioides albus]
MNVTVFGATGAIGSLTVAELLDRGHSVTAYARNPRKIPSAWADDVRLVIGEMSDAEAIDSAVAGSDAVISTLGPSMDRKAVGTPLVGGTENIVAAMKKHGVRRVVGQATPSILDPQEKPTMTTRLIRLLATTVWPRAVEELTGMSRTLMDPGLDWTIVRFSRPTDGPRTGNVHAGFFGSDRLGFAVSRADIAAFTAAQAESLAYVGRAPAISN